MNYKILIDPAHGGEDYGLARGDILAKNANLELCNYLSKRLNDFNISNQLIREADETINLKKRLNNLKELIKDKEYILLIIDANKESEIYYSLKEKENLPNLIAREISNLLNNSKIAIQKRFPINPKEDYHYLIRELSGINPILINYTLNEHRGASKDKFKDLGEAIVKALTNFLNIEYFPEVKPGYYKIEKGDTLWTISKKFHISTDELKQLNNKTNNAIKIGEIIKVKNIAEDKMEESRLIPMIENSMPKEIFHHVINGDTIFLIANKYNVTPELIKKANNLLSEEISVGQILLIPEG